MNTTKNMPRQRNYGRRLWHDLCRNRSIYLMLIPVLAWYIIFCYVPMYGVTMAFKNYKPRKGLMASDWVGFKYFIEFFNSFYFWRLMLMLKNVFCMFQKRI